MALVDRPNGVEGSTWRADAPTLASVSAATRQHANRSPVAGMAVLAGSTAWAALFGWLAVQRHLAGGSHAEDLGFTDQVLANFLRGQFFRMSIYQGATWNTELDFGHIARPDSLLAFHFEPLLLCLVPLYALGGMTLLLGVQALALAAGALPAYRLGEHSTGSTTAGGAVAAAYLLSPLGQWAALADFHTSALAAPLLLLAVERLVVARSPGQAVGAAALASLAREDVGLAVAALGASAVLRATSRRTGLALIGLGLGCTALALVVIHAYGSGMFLFAARYGERVSAGFGPALGALGRSGVPGYVTTLGLSGGWLGLLAPLALLPALPSLAFNTLSTSPWMMTGKAHYSALVLPFVAIGAAAGLGRIARPGPMLAACTGLVVTSLLGYALEGAGPLAGNYAPASVTRHALAAEALANGLPPEASVSATSALVPRLSRRERVYVFPTIADADYVFLDLQASPAPTSAGDVFLRVQALLANGGWQVDHAIDQLLLLQRIDAAGPTPIEAVARDLRPALTASAAATPALEATPYADGRVQLLTAQLVPSTDGTIDVDGPRWTLRTVWLAREPLPAGTRLSFWLTLREAPAASRWDIADLWWNPPEQWVVGQPTTVEVPDIPLRRFVSWQAVYER